MGRPTTTRARRGRADDSGFTLVEAVVALFVLGIVFSALAVAAMGSIRASMNARAEQQAIDFATQALERARQLDYYGLGHDETDLLADSANVDPCDTTWCFDPGSGPEELVLMPGGSINPHVQVVSSDVNNGTSFTVATYVTRALDSGADVKRVTVVTSWSIAGRERERATSSIVTATTRGLPVPLFAFDTPLNTQPVNPWTGVAGDPVPVVAFKVEMTNQGAPDRWDLTTDGGTWTFWRDNGDNVLCMDAAVCGEGVLPDTLMADSDDEGTAVDTGRLDPTTSITFWVVRQVPETSLGEYWNTLTATAVSLQHGGLDEGAGVKELPLRTIVTDEVITGQPGGGTPMVTLPTAPRDLTLTVGNGELTASWLTPETDGSSPVTDYLLEYKASAATTWITESDTSTALTRLLTGLANGLTYDVRVAARSAAGIGPFSAVAQGAPEGVTPYVPPTFCAPNPNPAPSPSHDSSYTLWTYTLHNRSAANPSWPGTGAPPPTSTTAMGVPLNMIKDSPAVGLGTALPIMSSDVSSDPGRVIRPGGGILTASSNSAYFVDWRTNVPGKRYSGTAVLAVWVAPAATTASATYQLTAQLYKSTATDTVMDATGNLKGMGTAGNSQSVSVSTAATTWCGGAAWQQVSIALPIEMNKALAADEYLGVRLWNSGTSDVRIAYDVQGDFPATLVLPEK
jgi:type II secretory pathway pseudopilin PulG